MTVIGGALKPAGADAHPDTQGGRGAAKRRSAVMPWAEQSWVERSWRVSVRAPPPTLGQIRMWPVVRPQIGAFRS